MSSYHSNLVYIKRIEQTGKYSSFVIDIPNVFASNAV